MSDLTISEWFRRALGAEYGGEAPTPGRVGELELAGFQARAARRGLEMARRFGGVLLADAVGLGKTRVALSIAASLSRDERKVANPSGVLCVAPARLQTQWRAAADKAGVTEFDFLSHTALSMHGHAGPRPGVVIADEAHKFRNPRAKRSQALAELAEGASVVMLSATPVCNSLMDLYQLLSVFCAEEDFRALVGYDLREAFEAAERDQFDITELLHHVVIRRTAPPDASGLGGRPAVELEMLRYDAVEDEAWLWRHLEARIGELDLAILEDNWPRGLFEEYVLKRWESGPRALADSLERLVEYHRRWLQARRCGRTLSRRAFKDLFGDAHTMRQEVFPFLFDAPSDRPEPQPAHVRADLERLEELFERALRLTRQGDGRIKAVVELAGRLDGKLLAFASYQSSAEELYAALCNGLGARSRIAVVTGQGARATGLGRVCSDEILRRFAPRAHGVTDMSEHHQIEVLVATDCLSEGVNLQDCANIVLADLPYSPLAVEQRVGRLVRPGSVSDTVRVFLPRPTSWQDSLGLRRRLRGKLDAAAKSGSEFTTTSQLLITPPESPADQALDNPLAAMTRLDRVASTLEAEGAEPLPVGDYVADAATHEPALWVRYATSSGGRRQFGWLRATESDGVVARLGANLPWLIAASEIESSVRKGPPIRVLSEQCEGYLQRRRRRLRSARAAPRQIAVGSAQRALWRLICDGVERGDIELDEERLARLRDAVLRAHARGRLRRIERAMETGLSSARALALAETLVDADVEHSATVDVEVLGRLQLVGG